MPSIKHCRSPNFFHHHQTAPHFLNLSPIGEIQQDSSRRQQFRMSDGNSSIPFRRRALQDVSNVRKELNGLAQKADTQKTITQREVDGHYGKKKDDEKAVSKSKEQSALSSSILSKDPKKLTEMDLEKLVQPWKPPVLRNASSSFSSVPEERLSVTNSETAGKDIISRQNQNTGLLERHVNSNRRQARDESAFLSGVRSQDMRVPVTERDGHSWEDEALTNVKLSNQNICAPGSRGVSSTLPPMSLSEMPPAATDRCQTLAHHGALAPNLQQLKTMDSETESLGGMATGRMGSGGTPPHRDPNQRYPRNAAFSPSYRHGNEFAFDPTRVRSGSVPSIADAATSPTSKIFGVMAARASQSTVATSNRKDSTASSNLALVSTGATSDGSSEYFSPTDSDDQYSLIQALGSLSPPLGGTESIVGSDGSRHPFFEPPAVPSLPKPSSKKPASGRRPSHIRLEAISSKLRAEHESNGLFDDEDDAVDRKKKKDIFSALKSKTSISVFRDNKKYTRLDDEPAGPVIIEKTDNFILAAAPLHIEPLQIGNIITLGRLGYAPFIKIEKTGENAYKLISGTITALAHEAVNPVYNCNPKNGEVTDALVRVAPQFVRLDKILRNSATYYKHETLESAYLVTNLLTKTLEVYSLCLNTMKLSPAIRTLIAAGEKVFDAGVDIDFDRAKETFLHAEKSCHVQDDVILRLILEVEREPLYEEVAHACENARQMRGWFSKIMAMSGDMLADYFMLVDSYLFRDACTQAALSKWTNDANHNEDTTMPHEWAFLKKGRDDYDYIARLLRRSPLIKNFFHVGLVHYTEPSERTAHIQKMIFLAAKLIKSGNYETSTTIVDVLLSPEVQSREFKSSWKALNREDETRFEDLKAHRVGADPKRDWTLKKKGWKPKVLDLGAEIIPHFPTFFKEVSELLENAVFTPELDHVQIQQDKEFLYKKRTDEELDKLDDELKERERQRKMEAEVHIENLQVLTKKIGDAASKLKESKLNTKGQLKFETLVFRNNPPSLLSSLELFHDHSVSYRGREKMTELERWTISKRSAQGPLNQVCFYVEMMTMALWNEAHKVDVAENERIPLPYTIWNSYPELSTGSVSSGVLSPPMTPNSPPGTAPEIPSLPLTPASTFGNQFVSNLPLIRVDEAIQGLRMEDPAETALSEPCIPADVMSHPHSLRPQSPFSDGESSGCSTVTPSRVNSPLPGQDTPRARSPRHDQSFMDFD